MLFILLWLYILVLGFVGNSEDFMVYSRQVLCRLIALYSFFMVAAFIEVGLRVVPDLKSQYENIIWMQKQNLHSEDLRLKLKFDIREYNERLAFYQEVKRKPSCWLVGEAAFISKEIFKLKEIQGGE